MVNSGRFARPVDVLSDSANTLRYSVVSSQVKYPISRIENNSRYKEGTKNPALLAKF